MTSTVSNKPATARSWGRTIAILGGSLAAYVAATLLVTVLTGDAIAGAAVSALVVTALALVYRWRSTGTPLAGPPKPRALTPSFWITAVAGLTLCWVAGQTAAAWVYSTWGSAGYDAVNATKMDSPVWLVVATALILAPLGEESLMRGIAYPALRRHWPPLASAFVTAMVFALLHGNVVQIALTVPLGLLLAFVYEAAQRLWPVVVMHVVFNVAASFIPKTLVEGIAQLPMVIALAVAVALVLFALTPGRYAVEDAAEGSGPEAADGQG
jgi:membrane protease YdiL (CAAX protease family)